MLNTFFEGSIEKAMTAMVDLGSAKLSEEQWRRLSEMIERAKDAQRREETTSAKRKSKGKPPE